MFDALQVSGLGGRVAFLELARICIAMQLMEWGGGCLRSLNLHTCLMPAELIW